VTRTEVEFLQGTLDLMILKALTWGPAHGYTVARWIEQTSGDVLRVEEGSLYPALHRLEERGYLDSTWGASENNRRAKFYQLTTQGRQRVRAESANWTRYAQAVFRILETTKRPA
jgi:PadR family transcriptional regulator, regulatory protein PadR